jgi:hypothetical protein
VWLSLCDNENTRKVSAKYFSGSLQVLWYSNLSVFLEKLLDTVSKTPFSSVLTLLKICQINSMGNDDKEAVRNTKSHTGTNQIFQLLPASLFSSERIEKLCIALTKA